MIQFNMGISPFKRTDIDMCFHECDLGNNYILAITDYFNKWSESSTMANQETAIVAEAVTVDKPFESSITDVLKLRETFSVEAIPRNLRIIERN